MSGDIWVVGIICSPALVGIGLSKQNGLGLSKEKMSWMISFGIM